MIPSFFIIGAPKCGTTTLYTWLKSHPDIFMPEGKEPHFFSQHLSDRYCRIRSKENYLSLFQGAKEKPAQICGEASVLYGFYPESLRNILAFNPEAKFIFMLRNPIEMAPSYHRQLLINLEEDVKNFEQAWDLQEERKNGNHLPKTSTDPELLQYKHACTLGNHLEKSTDVIPNDQLLTVFLEDIKDNQKDVYNQVLEFLNITNNHEPVFTKENTASAVRFNWLQKIILNPPSAMKAIAKPLKKIGLPLGKLANTINKKEFVRTRISKSFEEKLFTHFADDITKIESLTGRDLSHWKEASTANSEVSSAA